MQFFLFLFSILTAAGAWAAWRRSPVYSGKSTLQLAGAIGLLVIALIAGLTAVFSGGAALSPLMQGILAMTVITGLATGAAALIVRITDSHVICVPPSATILTTERRKIQRWMWRIAAFVAVCAGAAVVLPEFWQWAPLMLDGFVLVVAGPSIVALYMSARRLDMGMSSVMAAPWARWRYPVAEWQAWGQNQLELERSQVVTIAWIRDWRKMLGLAAAFLAAAWIMDPRGPGERVSVAGAGLAAILVCGAIANRSSRRAPDRRYRRLLAAPAEAIFGDEGVYCGGRFAPWILSGSYLVRASVHHDPPARLELVFQTYRGSASVREVKKTPIPAGREADLPAIDLKLRARCPKAAVHLA